MFNKFNNTGARILDSIHHVPLKLLEISLKGRKHKDFAIFYATL